MATNRLRSLLLRTLPALLLVLLTFFAAWQSASTVDLVEPEPEPSAPVDVAAAVLSSQFTAGVRGSRAPPVAFA